VGNAGGGGAGVKGKKRAQLGKGTFAITYRVVGRAGVEASGVKEEQLYAVKTISAETLDDHGLDISAVDKEVAVLTSLKHPHVVRFIKFMSEARQFTLDGEVGEVVEHHLIMELAEGGSLASVIKGKTVPEAEKLVATPNTLPLVSTGIWLQTAFSFQRVLVSCVYTTFSAAQFCSSF
jgi:serine/threonine protein kinase